MRNTSLPEGLVAFAKTHRKHLVLSVYVGGGETDPAGQRNWEVSLKHGISRARQAVAGQAKPACERFDAAVVLSMARVPAGTAMHRERGWACLVSDTGDVHVESRRHTRTSGFVAAGSRGSFPASLPSRTTRRSSPSSTASTVASFASRMGPSLNLEHHEVSPHGEGGAHMGNEPCRGYHAGTRGTTQHDAAESHLRDPARPPRRDDRRPARGARPRGRRHRAWRKWARRPRA